MQFHKLTARIFIIGLLGLAGCRKYKEQTAVKNPAYIRVFNDIATTANFLDNNGATPFLTFIMDPHLDASGAPDTGVAIGDFLGTRQLYSLSYPINEGNPTSSTSTLIGNVGSIVVQQTANYEYPGNYHVLTAPPMNGFDLSSWAQVPSGKHRFVFVLRPQDSIAFSSLSSTIRKNIFIDTTLDLQPGEVYTLETVSTDLDNNKYGLYVRDEQFIHQAFSANQLYIGFVNLSGITPLSARYGFTSAFSDTTAISYSYLTYVDQIGRSGSSPAGTYTALPGYNNNYYTTLTRRMNTDIDYLSLPLLDRSYFFQYDTLRTYAQNLQNENATAYTPGTLPYVQFSLSNQDSASFSSTSYGPFVLNCAANPVTFNNYVPGVGATLNYTPNLNLITTVGGQTNIYPTLNIMEMVYDRVYMMQIQNAFNQVPN